MLTAFFFPYPPYATLAFLSDHLFRAVRTGFRERGRFADAVASTSADVGTNTSSRRRNEHDAFRCRYARLALTRVQVALR